VCRREVFVGSVGSVGSVIVCCVYDLRVCTICCVYMACMFEYARAKSKR
jgi:hypothetical protein